MQKYQKLLVAKCEWCGKSFSGQFSSYEAKVRVGRRFCRNSPCARESCLYITRINRVRNEINNDPEQLDIAIKLFKILDELSKSGIPLTVNQ